MMTGKRHHQSSPNIFLAFSRRANKTISQVVSPVASAAFFSLCFSLFFLFFSAFLLTSLKLTRHTKRESTKSHNWKKKNQRAKHTYPVGPTPKSCSREKFSKHFSKRGKTNLQKCKWCQDKQNHHRNAPKCSLNKTSDVNLKSIKQVYYYFMHIHFHYQKE